MSVGPYIISTSVSVTINSNIRLIINPKRIHTLGLVSVAIQVTTKYLSIRVFGFNRYTPMHMPRKKYNMAPFYKHCNATTTR